MRDYLEQLWFSFGIWCDQLDAVTEAVIVLALFAVGLAALTWKYFL